MPNTEVYRHKQDKLADAIGDIVELLTQHAADQVDEPENTDFLGDLDHVAELLGQVKSFLSGEG